MTILERKLESATNQVTQLKETVEDQTDHVEKLEDQLIAEGNRADDLEIHVSRLKTIIKDIENDYHGYMESVSKKVKKYCTTHLLTQLLL